MFVANHSNEYQLSFLDKNNFLTEREKRFLNQSWAKYFAESIFSKIDEEPYAVLYSEQSSRPNTPVNVILGHCSSRNSQVYLMRTWSLD